jgi:hypothetical protein
MGSDWAAAASFAAAGALGGFIYWSSRAIFERIRVILRPR